MKLLNKIFGGIMCGALMTTNVLGADDCSNITYKQSHPERCQYTNSSNATTFLAVGGGAVAAGGIVALVGMLGGGDSGSSHSNAGASTTSVRTVTPTNIHRSIVGNDVTVAELTDAISTTAYNRNATQYDEINLAYSLARNLDGAGTKIAVFDTDLSIKNSHGAAVMDVASGPIATAAGVQHYQIATSDTDFSSYYEIGNQIKRATNEYHANVYNNSWNASIAADTITNKYQLIAYTDANFVNAVASAAKNNDAIFVWAAGNDGATQSGLLSAMPNVVSELNGHFVNVVAWDSRNSTLAEYSNSCGVTKDYCITAPGTIKTSDDKVHVGTSFAAPVVSSAIAVIRQAWDYLKSETITQILFDTATDLGDPGVDEVYGHGMLDLEAATRPVGTMTVQISDEVSQPLQVARVSASVAHNIKSSNPTMASFDQYGRHFETKLADNISAQNRGLGFERLRGEDARTKVTFGDMEFGFYRNDMLSGTGFMATDGETTTTYIATNKSYSFGNWELFGRTQLGIARPQTSNESIISEFSNIYTASASVGVRGEQWSFSVGMPDTIVNGTMQLHLATGRNSAGATTYQDFGIDMASKPAVEYMANYRFLTAGFVDNPYGSDEFYVFAKTKMAF